MLSLLNAESGNANESLKQNTREMVTDLIMKVDAEFRTQKAKVLLHEQAFQRLRSQIIDQPVPRCVTPAHPVNFEAFQATEYSQSTSSQIDEVSTQNRIYLAYAELGAKYKSTVQELHRAHASLRCMESAFGDVQSILTMANADVAQLRSDYIAVQNSLSQARAELHTLNVQIAQLFECADKDRKDIQRRQRIIRSYEATVIDLEAECADWKARFQGMEEDKGESTPTPPQYSTDAGYEDLEDVTDLSMTMAQSNEKSTFGLETLSKLPSLHDEIGQHSSLTSLVCSQATSQASEISSLKKQLNVYKSLLQVLVQNPDPQNLDISMLNQLLESGLHKEAPIQRYVTKDFFAGAKKGYSGAKKSIAFTAALPMQGTEAQFPSNSYTQESRSVRNGQESTNNTVLGPALPAAAAQKPVMVPATDLRNAGKARDTRSSINEQQRSTSSMAYKSGIEELASSPCT